VKRTQLAKKGTSDTTIIKQDIQDTARAIVILRDGGCLLRGIRHCGGTLGQAVLQADHLITRGNSATYADTRLIVCLCRSCHGWKSLGSNLRKKEYDELVRSILPPDRVELWDRCERDSWRPKRTDLYDWRIALVVLGQELASFYEHPAYHDVIDYVFG
jgi:hypothetical protein